MRPKKSVADLSDQKLEEKYLGNNRNYHDFTKEGK